MSVSVQSPLVSMETRLWRVCVPLVPLEIRLWRVCVPDTLLLSTVIFHCEALVRFRSMCDLNSGLTRGLDGRGPKRASKV